MNADRSGLFEITGLADGKWELVASHDRYARSTKITVDVLGPGPFEQNLDVMLGAWVTGRVTTVSAAPISGAEIELNGDGHWAIVEIQVDGDYEILGLPEGTYEISVHSEEYAPQSEIVVSLEQGEHGTGIDFVLDPGVSVSGKVVEHTSNSPVTGGNVRLESATGLGPRRPTLTKATGRTCFGIYSVTSIGL